MPELRLPHSGHEKHLCYLLNMGYFDESDLERYKALVRNAKCVCRRCGRAAEKEKHLCEPEKL